MLSLYAIQNEKKGSWTYFFNLCDTSEEGITFFLCTWGWGGGGSLPPKCKHSQYSSNCSRYCIHPHLERIRDVYDDSSSDIFLCTVYSGGSDTVFQIITFDMYYKSNMGCLLPGGSHTLAWYTGLLRVHDLNCVCCSCYNIYHKQQ